MTNLRRRCSTLIGGLALFSMFFGAGNLIFPLLLGDMSGDQNLPAVLGLCITAVLFPLLGLLSIMLFKADHKSFFGRLGVIPGFLIYAFVQIVIGPVGSNPRLITVAYGTLKPYLPDLSLSVFSVIACLIVFLLVVRRQKLVDLLGTILTPLLIAALIAIVTLGLIHHPEPRAVDFGASASFFNGLKVGYNTLDLIASFLFAQLIYAKFRRESDHLPEDKRDRAVMSQFLKASLIAAVLLGLTYGGLSFVASYHVPYLREGLDPAELLSAMSIHMLGNRGAIIASIAVAMACVTTFVSLTAICGDYLHNDIFRKRVSRLTCVVLTLIVSGLLANLGFRGIMNMLGPLLSVAYPGLIALSVLNLIYKVRQFKPVKGPVAATLVLSFGTYLL